MNPPRSSAVPSAKIMLSITHYRAEWSFQTGTGRIFLVGPQGEHEIAGLDAMSFHAVVTLLRNERPIQYDPENQVVKTLNEITGEEEMD